jgi:hypothetical protein
MRRWLRARRQKATLVDKLYAALAEREFQARRARYEEDNRLAWSDDGSNRQC